MQVTLKVLGASVFALVGILAIVAAIHTHTSIMIAVGELGTLTLFGLILFNNRN
jgi:hypothetical protein